MSNRLHILLIDDNPDDRLLIIRELSQEFPDLQVEQIIDSDGFDRALEAGNFDLAITDYLLHWSDGLAVLRAVKARYPDRPVVMFTATATQETAVEAMKSGLDDYVIKAPKHYVRLRAVVRSVLEQARSRQRAAQLEMRLQELLNRLNVGVFRSTLDGRLLEGNAAFLRLLGVDSLEQAQTINLNEVYLEDRSQLLERLKEKGRAPEREVQLRRADGAIIWVSLGEVLAENAETIVDGLMEDITERKQAEERIKASLEEKEVLLKEIHHRVKNNLQIISSLLNLQSRYIGDSRMQEMFKESQNRVRTMALIHEKLYQSEDLARIDFAGYVRDLAINLFRSYGIASESIALKINVVAWLTIDSAIPCGLIINELVSNSLKHAFPPGRQGEIHISISSSDSNEITMIISDNGVGFPADIDFRSAETLGLRLVRSLTEQLGGTIELYSDGGTQFKITFTESK